MAAALPKAQGAGRQPMVPAVAVRYPAMTEGVGPGGTERQLMKLAVDLARQCNSEPGKVSPKVGAVVCNREGTFLDSAFRGELDPGEHAEYTLLERKLSDKTLAGGTLFTTLEPCTNRNYPKIACAERIIARRIARVVIGVLDPNGTIRGLGELRLRDAGIDIARFPSDLMSEIEELNRDFTLAQRGIAKAGATREQADVGEEAMDLLGTGSNKERRYSGHVGEGSEEGVQRWKETEGSPAGDPGGIPLLRTRQPRRVSEVSWQEAGVHPPIPEIALADDGQIPFVRRGVGRYVVEWLTKAIGRLGPSVLILQGESTAGKTRLAFEAMRAVCPSAWFIAPTTPRAAVSLCTLTVHPALDQPVARQDPVVFWLDDLEQFVGANPASLTRWHVEALQGASRPLVFLCTRGGRGQDRLQTEVGRLADIDDFVHATGTVTVQLNRRLDDDELAEAAETLQSVPIAALRDGLGSFAVARPRLQARYDGAADTGRCVAVGDPGDGRALVEGLLVLRAVFGFTPIDDGTARAAWERLRSRHDRHGPAAPANWDQAVAWATCAAVPGHPLVSWQPKAEAWLASELIGFRGDPVLQAHRHLTPVLNEWAGDDPFRALLIARLTHRPDREDISPLRMPPAEHWYQRVLARNSEDARAISGLARLREQQGAMDEARSGYLQALTIAPDDPETLANYALFTRANETPEVARAAHEAAATKAPSAVTFTNFGGFLDQMRETELALHQFLLALDQDPTHYTSLMGIASLLERIGRVSDALGFYCRAFDLGYLDIETLSRYLHLRGSHGTDVVEAYEQLLEHDEVTASVLRQYADVLRKHVKHPAGAIAVLERAIELDPSDIGILQDLGDVLLEQGRTEEALRLLERAARVDSGARKHLVFALHRQGEQSKVDAELAAWHDDAGSADRWYVATFSHVMQERGCATEAVALLPDVPETYANDPGLLHTYANLLFHAGDLARYVTVLEQAAHCYPPDANAIGDYASMLRQSGVAESAREVFERALAAEPAHANNNAHFALLLEEMGEHALSWEHVRLARESDPDLPLGLVIEAWLLHADGSGAEAAAVLNKAFDLSVAKALAAILLVSQNTSGETAIRANELFDKGFQRHLGLDDSFSRYAGMIRGGTRDMSIKEFYDLGLEGAGRHDAPQSDQ